VGFHYSEEEEKKQMLMKIKIFLFDMYLFCIDLVLVTRFSREIVMNFVRERRRIKYPSTRRIIKRNKTPIKKMIFYFNLS
jgi:hypothetical protein